MGKLDDANIKTNSLVSAIAGSPLFHAALPFIAAVIVASEHRWPSLKENIAGVLLLLTSLGRVTSSVMGFFGKAAADPADPTK